ncbi:MAG: sugar ABC transporter permease [Verrucomicrobiales bacterium]|jgi:raffinose/stachyose/melibiose transport system permease protein|nr:sugar ABC transporter permease [Verrucomicrobiales bacterium]
MPATIISTRKALRQWHLYLFVVPSLLLIGTFCYYPAISAIIHSFFDWQGSDQMQFLGLDNFKRALTDPILRQSFGTMCILVVANFFKMVPAILLAVVIHRLISDKWQYWYRVLLIVPMVVPGLVSLFIWKFFFDPNLGIINNAFDLLHIKHMLVWLDVNWFHSGTFRMDAPISWLSEPRLIIPSLIFWGFPWVGAVSVFIFLAGLQGIGTEVYEAAELDGASPFQKFTHIELPLIMTQVRLNVILMMIGALQDYGLQFMLLGGNGGAGMKGMVPGLWMFNRAFLAGEFGYACSIGIILFFLILLMTYINNKYIRVDK